MDYQVGDKVIHSNYGLGEIIQLDEKTVHGEQTPCYVVRVRDLTIWVPANELSDTRLRVPTSKKEFEKVFTIFQEIGVPLSEDRMERKTQLIDRMKDGTLTSICSVLRDLTLFGKIKKFNDSDTQYFKRAQNLLMDEWMLVFMVPLGHAQQELGKLLGA
jgi:RNA polymerase-interacting CarD/CdnL/TRCF family regulator